MAEITSRQRFALRPVGRRLLELRRHRGMSQSLLADAIGVAVGTIQNYERGRATMSIERAEQLALALNVESSDLLAPPGSPAPLFRYRTERVLQPAHRVDPFWASGMGFYGRAAQNDGRVDVDRATLRACGLAPNAPGAMAWIDWMKRIHIDDRARVQSELERLDQLGTFGLQYRLVGWDGVERSIVDCSRMSCDERGHPMRLQGAMIDVTQARRTSAVEREIARVIRAVRKS